MSNIDENIINSWAKELAENNKNIINSEPNELKQEFSAYKETWKTLKEMQEIQQFDTNKAWNNLYSKIEDDKSGEEHKPIRKVKFNKVFTVAASIILLIGIAGVYLFNAQISQVSHFNSGLNAQMINLPDGTQIYLNADSEISYSKSFGNDDLREVQMKGEAFFNVAKDKNRPFIIKAEHSYIKVLGTSFNVNAKQTNVEVIVKTGKVEVYNENNNIEHVVLLSGDRALMAKNSAIVKNSKVQDNYLSWLNRKLVFKAMPLSEVISDLNKTYHSEIVLGDTSIANLKITSTFDNDPIDEVLKSIAIAFNLDIEKDGKKYTLVSK
ncbi:MAG: FecR domain-containing protein [Salinivirgaceae bacterium]|jgi:transmembrane sensor|nr:FecR domain-containing protein [Salinivirgaceae bacterium]